MAVTFGHEAIANMHKGMVVNNRYGKKMFIVTEKYLLHVKYKANGASILPMAQQQ